jgi:PAS domain-containing protein
MRAFKSKHAFLLACLIGGLLIGFTSSFLLPGGLSVLLPLSFTWLTVVAILWLILSRVSHNETKSWRRSPGAQRSSDGLVVLDNSGKVLVASARAHRLLGADGGRLRGASFPQLLRRICHQVSEFGEFQRELQVVSGSDSFHELWLKIEGTDGAKLRIYCTPLDSEAPLPANIACVLDDGQE